MSGVLIDVRRSHGELGIIDRYRHAEEMAETWPREIAVAALIREDQLVPDRFWETVTRNRGLKTGVFMDEALALEWLGVGTW